MEFRIKYSNVLFVDGKYRHASFSRGIPDAISLLFILLEASDVINQSLEAGRPEMGEISQRSVWVLELASSFDTVFKKRTSDTGLWSSLTDVRARVRPYWNAAILAGYQPSLRRSFIEGRRGISLLVSQRADSKS